MLIDMKVCSIQYGDSLFILYPSLYPMYVVPVMTTIVLYDRTVSSEYDKAHTRELHQLARSQDPDLLR